MASSGKEETFINQIARQMSFYGTHRLSHSLCALGILYFLVALSLSLSGSSSTLHVGICQDTLESPLLTL
jgi:DNA-binding transcriptional regulator GbsR (MarR family)